MRAAKFGVASLTVLATLFPALAAQPLSPDEIKT